MGDDLKGMDVLIFSQMFTKDYFPARFVVAGIIFEKFRQTLQIFLLCVPVIFILKTRIRDAQ